MNPSLIPALVSIPAGIVLASVGTVGISGALVFTAGSALGAFGGLQLARTFVFRHLPECLHEITNLALIILSTASGGWLLANACNFPISFTATLLIHSGGMMLVGGLLFVAAFLGRLFSRLFTIST